MHKILGIFLLIASLEAVNYRGEVTQEDRWTEEHTVPDKPDHPRKKYPEGVNDYEKSPNAHNYFDNPDWPEVKKE